MDQQHSPDNPLRQTLDATPPQHVPSVLESASFSPSSDEVQEQRSSEISIEAIDQRMEHDGFPELDLLWREFQSSKQTLQDLNDPSIAKKRAAHMSPLLGKVRAATATLGVAAATIAYQYYALVAQGSSSFSQLGQTGLSLFAGAGAVLLGTLVVTALQRRVLHPMMKIMSQDVAYMLSRKDYRASVEKTPYGDAFKQDLYKVGIGTNWDNPEYIAHYDRNDSKTTDKESRWIEVEPVTGTNFVQKTLRDFLGYMDTERRKHVPGRYAPDLLNGKKSVTKFIGRFKAEIQLGKDGRLSVEDGQSMLQTLQSEFVKKESRGDAVLTTALSALERGDYITGKVVEAKIWERDPWRDLTHQEEFFSSASLRGVKLMGRGIKGRLGTFGYLRNLSISALDFSTKKGRVVRARIGAAKEIGTDRAILYVDGVEGTITVERDVIQRGIEDYARRTGFSAIVYNKYVHNKIPRRFVEHLEAQDMPLYEMDIEYIDSSTREYLDGFGWPLEPFEYKIPRGKVMGYITSLEREQDSTFQEAKLSSKVYGWIRQNSLWILTGNTVGFASLIIGSAAPYALIPFYGMVGGLAYLHVQYQRKSLRSQESLRVLD